MRANKIMIISGYNMPDSLDPDGSDSLSVPLFPTESSSTLSLPLHYLHGNQQLNLLRRSRVLPSSQNCTEDGSGHVYLA